MNHRKRLSNLSNLVKIVLVETSHPGNIGASARAMKNMGLSGLALVSPKEFPSDIAYYRSKAASDILANTKIYESLNEAIEDCTLVIGTSARNRSVPWPMIVPRLLSENINETLFNGGKVAIIFGREDSGLSNEELGLCNLHLNIPSDKKYNSLNLAQAVQIICYELRLGFLTEKDYAISKWDVNLANSDQVERLIKHTEQLMDDVKFYDKENPRKVLLRMRRFFKRSCPDEMEVNILRGLFSEIQKKINK
tara:strand:- start:17555 stop:18307 length:753 start_codon:yes stop_codon:yes gene_type:complete